MKHILLPMVTLGAPLLAITTRLTRSSMLEVMKQDYVLFAKAKGLPDIVVHFKHCLKNALIPLPSPSPICGEGRGEVWERIKVRGENFIEPDYSEYI